MVPMWFPALYLGYTYYCSLQLKEWTSLLNSPMHDWLGALTPEYPKSGVELWKDEF